MRSALADALRAPLGWEPWLRKAAGVWGASARCLRRALALAHTMCRAANYSNQGAAPGRPWHRRLEDSVAQVWSFEELPPVLRLCGAAAESSARKKKSTAPNVIRLLFSFMSTFVFFSFMLN